MNKYEKLRKAANTITTILPHYKELVERATNGIYISKEDTSELLEALCIVGEEVRDYGWKYCKTSYDKLHKALDWSDEE